VPTEEEKNNWFGRYEKHTIISEKKIHSLINTHETAMYETLGDGTVKWVSKRWLEITGLTLDEAIGYGWINSIHESDRSNVQQAWQKAIEEKRDFQMSYRTQSNKFVNSKATPVITNKVPIGWIGIVEEINKAP
jgi:PAS domain S-box-containing protein